MDLKQSQNQGDEVLQGVGLTALIVAQARAVESKRPDSLFIDPFAEDFVARAGEAFLQASAEFVPILALRGNGRYFALRTRFFDDFVVDVCRAGCQQVILLGAGLDTRAFRLALPDGVTLFELDLPHVLAFKEEVLSARAVAPICQRLVVPVDLRWDWAKALVAAGFEASKPTTWVLEGILMYLTEAERDHFLDEIGRLSAWGSRLALEQRGVAASEPQAAPTKPTDSASADQARQAMENAESTVVRFGVTTSSERPDFSMVDPAAWVARHGWQAQVYGAAERFAFYGRPVPPALAAGAVQLWLVSAERP